MQSQHPAYSPEGVQSLPGAAEARRGVARLSPGFSQASARRFAWAVAAVDGTLLALAMNLGVWTYMQDPLRGFVELVTFSHFPAATWTSIVFGLICLHVFELYSQKEFHRSVSGALRVSLAIVTVSIAMSVQSYWLPWWAFFRGMQLYFSCYALFFLLLWRSIVVPMFVRSLPPTRLVLLGDERRLAVMEEMLEQHPWVKLAVAARVATEPDGAPSAAEEAQEGSLLALARKHDATLVVAALNTAPADQLLHDLLSCKAHGLGVLDGASLYKRVSGRVPIRLADKSWFAFGPDFELSGSFGVRALQRAMDLVLACIGLVLAAPIMLLVALVIALTDGRPVLYFQERVGQNWRLYQLVKFRTMSLDAEKDGPQWAQANDSRLIRVGRFLRSTRLDELPQLWNVLVGEMSFIGPRPERKVFVDALSKTLPYYGLRLSIRPGLTGWAQVNYGYGASETDAAIKLEYDLFYIQESSFYLNILILLRTVSTVLFRRGT